MIKIITNKKYNELIETQDAYRKLVYCIEERIYGFSDGLGTLEIRIDYDKLKERYGVKNQMNFEIVVSKTKEDFYS